MPLPSSFSPSVRVRSSMCLIYYLYKKEQMLSFIFHTYTHSFHIHIQPFPPLVRPFPCRVFPLNLPRPFSPLLSSSSPRGPAALSFAQCSAQDQRSTTSRHSAHIRAFLGRPCLVLCPLSLYLFHSLSSLFTFSVTFCGPFSLCCFSSLTLFLS